MAKNCVNSKCEKEIPSGAAFCSFCGTQQVDSESLSEEEKLRRKLSESEKTSKLLKKSLAEAYVKIDKSVCDENLKDQITTKDKEIERLKCATKKKKKKNNVIYLLFFILSVLLGAVVINYYIVSVDKQSEINYLKGSKNSIDKELQKLKYSQQNVKNENEKLQQKLDEIAIYHPIIIKSLKIGNVYKNSTLETNFGEIIYASNSMFLQPQIEYIGIKSNKKITLYQKIFKSGVLSSGSSSPVGYSTKTDVNLLDEGKIALTGWGGENKGNWSSGSYRYEIWYNNMCIKALDFYLY